MVSKNIDCSSYTLPQISVCSNAYTFVTGFWYLDESRNPEVTQSLELAVIVCRQDGSSAWQWCSYVQGLNSLDIFNRFPLPQVDGSGGPRRCKMDWHNEFAERVLADTLGRGQQTFYGVSSPCSRSWNAFAHWASPGNPTNASANYRVRVLEFAVTRERTEPEREKVGRCHKIFDSQILKCRRPLLGLHSF